MHIQTESPDQTDTRPREVLRIAEIRTLPGQYHFAEFPHATFATSLHPEALALIRDGDRWSQLLPIPDGATAPDFLTLISIHFPAAIDNSGFVGWLATLIRQHTGSGVAVICGQNTLRGGIFDYWAAPSAAAPAIHQLLTDVRSA